MPASEHRGFSGYHTGNLDRRARVAGGLLERTPVPLLLLNSAATVGLADREAGYNPKLIK
jgi:hypothetical protein